VLLLLIWDEQIGWKLQASTNQKIQEAVSKVKPKKANKIIFYFTLNPQIFAEIYIVFNVLFCAFLRFLRETFF
jgi:hypothetical protein